MAKQVPIAKEHIELLNSLHNNKKVIIEELGKVTLQEILIEKRREKAVMFLDKVTEQETSIAKTLEKVYGQGTIDLPNKVFIPQQ
jgi:hypothetical protein